MRRLQHLPVLAAVVFAAWSGFTPLAACYAQKLSIPAKPPAFASAAGLPRIVFNNAPLPIASPFRALYRDAADGVLCIAPESLAPLGVVFVVDEDMGKVSLVGPNGNAATVALRIPSVSTGRSGAFVSAIEAIEGLGGKCEWEPGTNTLHARSVLTGVEMLGGQLRLRATLPVVPIVTSDRGGRQIIVSVPGAEVGGLPRTLSLNAPNVASARTGQFSDDVARIVLDMKQPSGFAVLGGASKAATQVVFNPAAVGPDVSSAAASQPAPKPAPAAKRVVLASRSGSKTTRPALPASVVSGITFRSINDNKAQFVVSADRAPAFRAGLRKGKLTLDLLNTTLAPAMSPLDVITHPLVKAAQVMSKSGDGVSSLVLSLSRAVCYSVQPGSKGSLLLELTMPRSAGGTLAGRTIVVDAGHGGHDSGAMGVNGTREKNVALAIATNLAENLREAGANVLMTRSDDTFVDLGERSNIANRMGADFFIAVHADSGDNNHAANGSTIYYHMDNAACRTLALCIAERMADMGGIRSKGAHSDGTIYGSGFSVLRRSQMVSVLCETGYMSNASDVRLLNDTQMQKKIAANIASGLRDYIEGNPDFDTRNVNPDAGGASLGTPPDPLAPANEEPGQLPIPEGLPVPDPNPTTPPQH